MSDSHIKSRKTYSCTHDQCIYTTKRSHDLERHLSKHHGEGQSRGHESSPERTTHIRTAKQSIISSVPECQRAPRKPRDSDSDSSESVVIIEPSNSRTPIDKPKNEKTRKGPTSSESAVAIDNSLNEEIPEGTVNVQPEAAPDGEEDWYKSKEFRKQFSPKLKDRKDSNKQNVPPTVKSVFCTACGTQVNQFNKNTFSCHPVLSVVICKKSLELYNRCLWKKDKHGFEEECRWCGDGGQLSLCDFCGRTFCKRCIMRNLGRAEWNRTLSKKKWECYVCDPSSLKELVAKCNALLARSVKTEKKEREKENVSVQKKVVKAPKKENMQDAAIAEEFLQFLVGNISNRALFMRSLMRLTNEVPDMQKLQMKLSLKHIGEVKTVLGEFEDCVKKHLHGDAHKSNSALDGTDPEDLDSPERKSKSQMEETGFNTEKKDESAGEDQVMKEEESAMDTAEGDGLEDADISQKESSDDTKGSEHNEENVKISENSPIADVDMEGNDGGVEANRDKATSETKGNELKEKEQIETCPEKESEPDSYSTNHKKVTDDAIMNAQEGDGNDYSHDTDCPSSQHSARKMKITPSAPRSRRESQGANLRGSQDSKSQEDEKSKLMSMIGESDVDSCDESEGSEYNPNKSTRSLTKSPQNAKKKLFKKFPKAVKKEPVSSADSDHDETAKRREGPGGSSWDEGGEQKDKAEKKKDSISAVTGTGKSRHSSAATESESSEKISESKSEKSDDNTKPRGRKLSSKKKKNEPEKMYSASEVEMILKRHEGIQNRKRNRGTDSDDASEEGKAESFAKKDKEKANVEKESESEINPSKKAKKIRQSPTKIDPKSGELRSFDSSDDESNAESDGCSGLRWKSLNKKSKKGDSQEVAENLLMGELDSNDEEDDDDDDDEDDEDDEGDKDDEDEEVDGEVSKRSENKTLKKAEEVEYLNNSERRQNGAGGGGGIRDGKNGGGDKKKRKKRTGPYKGSKKSGRWRKKKAQKKAKENEDWNNSARQNGTRGGGGSGDGKNGGDYKRNKGKGQDESTMKSHPLLITNYSEDDEDEDHTSKKKKGKEVKAAPQKEGKVTKKRRRKAIDGVSGEKPKQKRVSRSETASSSEESSVDEGTNISPLQAAESPDPARMRTPQNIRKTKRARQLHRKNAKSPKRGGGKRLKLMMFLHRRNRAMSQMRSQSESK